MIYEYPSLVLAPTKPAMRSKRISKFGAASTRSPLPRWTETEDFRDFVSAFGKIFPLRKASSLGERGLVQRLLQASEGITGPLTRLLSLAAVEAIHNSGECIDEAGIDLAATRLERDFT
jgi:hypothetical protein